MYLRHYQKLEEGSVNATLRTLRRLCQGFRVDVRALF
jgi:DNA-binding XRE family transcriptional regulator